MVSVSRRSLLAFGAALPWLGRLEWAVAAPPKPTDAVLLNYTESPYGPSQAAREAASGQDVRIGGGATVVRDFLAAGLVDQMHVVQVPLVLGRGVRLWDGLEGLEDSYDVEAVSSPSGVVHLTFRRALA